MEQFNPFVPKVRYKEEVWKHHSVYKRLQISNLGRYKLKEKVRHKDKYIWSEPKFADNTRGYQEINYRLFGDERIGRKKSEQLYVHHLVAELFCENPDDKPWIDHVDGNAHNPAAYNLEYVTPKENTDRAVALGLRKAAKAVVEITKFKGITEEFSSVSGACRKLKVGYAKMKQLIESGQQDIFGVSYHYKEAT